MCWEPKVMRLFTGGELYLCTYALRNWPPDEGSERRLRRDGMSSGRTLRETYGVEANLQLGYTIQLFSYKVYLLVHLSHLRPFHKP